MNWIKQVVILFVFTSGLTVRSSAGTRPKFQPLERYEFCVARNLTGSPLFTEEEKVRMSKIAMETDLRMHEMEANPGNGLSAKSLLRLFAAALACVVADCDSSQRPQREQACLTALEACAVSLQEQAGVEVVREMKKIFSAMNREISALDAISDNSASVEARKKERSEKENKAEKAEERLEEIEAEKKERLEEIEVQKKEERQEKESEAKKRPKRAYVPMFRYQAFSTPLQSNPTLDSIIADKLLKSATFKNLFTVGLAQEDAIFYSRSMTAAGMGGYRNDIIDEAMNAVTNAVYRLGSFAGSRDYASAIGRSIASVLAAHELTFYADGLGIGSSLVYQLDSMLGSNPSAAFPLSPGFSSVSVSSSGWGSSSSMVSSQSSGMASVQVNPSYVEPSFAVPPNPQNDKTQFQNRLSYFLSQSPRISDTFCSGPFPGLYEVMSSAFADYGYPIASTIATVVSNSLNMLPIEAACTQYAEVISEIVADIIDNNGLILASDPQAIANKISDLISPNIQGNPRDFRSPNTQSNPPQNPSGGFGQQPFSGSEYQLNPSFSDDYSYSDPENPALPVDQYPDSPISGSAPNTPVQQQTPVLTNSTEFSFDDPPPPVIQTSSKQDFNSPTELSSDEEYSPDRPPPSEDYPASTNNSWVVVDYPSDMPTDLDQTNQTSGSADIAPPVVLGPGPIILEPGPVIPEKTPVDTGSAPESKMAYPDEATTPETIEVTKLAEMFTPMPFDSNFQSSTVMEESEVVTPTPQVALKDAFESQSKLSEFLMQEMSSLKGSNATSGEENKQPDNPETAGDSTGVENTQTGDSSGVENPQTGDSSGVENPQTGDSSPTLKDSQSDGNPPVSQDDPSSNQTSTGVQPTVETPLQPDLVPLTAPKPITDEVSALVFADKVSSIVSSAVGLIRSQNLEFGELCNRLNELAPLVDIPPLDVCSEIPLIDYLLHVLNAVTYSLAGE